jgi:curved DNA-binding protein CbpA
MKLTDAAHILGLSGTITPDDVKRCYRQAAMHYHPDRNPAGVEMMKLINAAYEVLKEFSGTLDTGPAAMNGQSYPEAVNAALNAIFGLAGLDIEICGAWVWVGGQTYPHREALKAAGFKFAGQKKRWYFRPEDWRSSSRGNFTMDDIRSRYGSVTPNFRRDLLEEEASSRGAC